MRWRRSSTVTSARRGDPNVDMNDIFTEVVTVLNKNPEFKLLASLAIDFMGMSSFLLPGLGELSDAGWAPISAFLIQKLYGSGALTALGFAEEALPGLDFMPTATIGWVLENIDEWQGVAKLMGIKTRKSRLTDTDTIIDIDTDTASKGSSSTSKDDWKSKF
eukprot:jgi/Mesvir1/6811/Mv09003-RA.1